jgi:hypothetical protein
VSAGAQLGQSDNRIGPHGAQYGHLQRLGQGQPGLVLTRHPLDPRNGSGGFRMTTGHNCRPELLTSERCDVSNPFARTAHQGGAN